MSLTQYHSEMQAKPENMDFQAIYMPYSDKFRVEGKKEITGMKRGVKFVGVMDSSELTEFGQYKAGWNEYSLTQAAFKALCKKYNVCQELLLD